MSDTSKIDNLSPVKQALLEIRQLRGRLEEVQQARTEPIAIIGMGLRFPGGANDPETFWQLLRDGVDAITEIPTSRWDLNAYYDPDSNTPGKMYSRGGGFLEEVDQFDAPFFGIAPREAVSMDPQQRLLLQVCWEALEHAGQAPDKLNGSPTGVFFGLSNSDYSRLLFTDPADIDVHFVTGTAYSVAVGRLSYLLGLQGPNMAIDTACSSSLVAIHLAMQSLRARESDMALAGGVNLILTPEMNINFCQARMMAFDDRCKTFDAAADGYVRGEGCGVVVLKRLSDAVANGDNILALIRGSAINQDGRSSSLTAPNGPAQEAVISNALANGGVKPNQVNYLEAHGTGTSLGDPIEVQALAAVLGEGRSADNPLMIGSVKTNIGHLEAAAGIAGLIKVVLCLQHEEIPPHLHLQQLSPYIPWDKFPVVVPTTCTPWPQSETPRFGSVSSFGFSGTNAHVVIQEAPRQLAPVTEKISLSEARSQYLLTLSAKRPPVLKELAAHFEKYLTETEVDFKDVCFTANVGRAHLTHRLAVVANSTAQAREKLAAFRAGQEPVGVSSGQVSTEAALEAAFLFTGHGDQYVNMGRQLYQTEPKFRASLEECDALLRPYLDQSLLSVLYPASDQDETAHIHLMEQMTYAQPALFALEYALASLWRSWGVEPAVVLGHSLGEYVAACVAGVYSLADGLKLVAARGRLMDSLPQTGQMAAVFADEERVAAKLAPYADQVSIAAVNGPTNIVISGAKAVLQIIIEDLKADGIKVRPLAIPQAAHSPMLDPILDSFEKIAAEVTYAPPQIGLISGITGQLAVEAEVTTAGYWRRHLRETVRFSAAMETMHREGLPIFIEIGPHPTLLGMARRGLPEAETAGQLWLPSLRRGQDDWQEILESLGALYVRGWDVNWPEVERSRPGRRVSLPTYPWAKERYWVESRARQLPAHSPETSLWPSIVEAGRRQSGQGPLELGIQTYPTAWDLLDRLATAYMMRALQGLGAFTQPAESHSIESLLAQTNVLPDYSRLLSRWLKWLATAGLLHQESDHFTYLQPLADTHLATLRQEARQRLGELSPLLDYIERCGEKLESVLTGAESPLETLFPGGSYVTVNYLYHEWPVIRYFNGILENIVETIFKTLPPNKHARILELGAGTGGTAAALLPRLPAERTHYLYTDVSDFFLSRAEEKFKDYSFVRYALLDIEQDPEQQGYAPHSFDMVIAANVLHATQNLSETLAHVLSLLTPGGLLLLLEGTQYLSWFDITTGLIEGWERFEDDLRQDNPLLSAGQWQEILRAAGFEEVAAFPETGAPAEILIHHILAAQAPSTGNGSETAFQTGDYFQTEPGVPSETARTEETASATLLDQLAIALPDERRELLVNYVRGHVARILRLPASHPLDRHDRLMDLGLDSLMAVELRGRLGAGLGLKRSLSATLAFDYPTPEAIASHLERELFASNEPVAEITSKDIASTPSFTASTGKTVTTAELETLSDDEVEALLLKKLKDI